MGCCSTKTAMKPADIVVSIPKVVSPNAQISNVELEPKSPTGSKASSETSLYVKVEETEPLLSDVAATTDKPPRVGEPSPSTAAQTSQDSHRAIECQLYLEEQPPASCKSRSPASSRASRQQDSPSSTIVVITPASCTHQPYEDVSFMHPVKQQFQAAQCTAAAVDSVVSNAGGNVFAELKWTSKVKTAEEQSPSRQVIATSEPELSWWEVADIQLQGKTTDHRLRMYRMMYRMTSMPAEHMRLATKFAGENQSQPWPPSDSDVGPLRSCNLAD